MVSFAYFMACPLPSPVSFITVTLGLEQCVKGTALEGKRALQLDLKNNASLTNPHKLQFDENYRQTLCCELLFTG